VTNLESRVLDFIREPGGEAELNELALAVFAHQYEQVPIYRRFCERRGVEPGGVARWEEVPALPADAFKHGLDAADRPHVFLSSGTTAGPEQRSRHAVESLAAYEASALAHFRAMVLADEPGPLATLVLGPTAASHPHSSLGRMFSWCVDLCSNGDSLVAFDADGRTDIAATVTWLGEKSRESAPVLILAVTSALTAVFEALRDRHGPCRLPADSRIVDTGGRKGTAHALSPNGVLKAAWRWLHVPAYLCVNEYGMTEMFSQFYDDALESRASGRLSPRAKVSPPWVRTRIVDPATLEPAAPGTVGLLRHFDLANWESVSALQTLDLAREVGIGFELRGRAAGAEARGCSALVTEILDARADDGA
jgi:hypothetical protein